MEFWTGVQGTIKTRKMPGSLATGYDSFVNGAKEAEALGFDGYGAGEHHFMYDSTMPLAVQALAAAAAVTSRIRFVTGAMLLPQYDPLEAAELAATVDVVSGGRVTLGLGMGYRPYEFDGLSMEKKARGARLVEGMKVFEQATSGERFSFEGRYYSYDNACVRPTPIQRPIPTWFCGGTSVRAAQRAGKAGLPYWMANASFEQASAIAREYREVGRAAGWPEERLRLAAFKDVCIGDTVEEAEELKQLLLSDLYEEHILCFGYLVDDEGNHLYHPPKDHPVYRRFVDSIYTGTVEMIIDEFRRYEDMGFEALFLMTAQRELIAEHIIPEFK